MTNRRKALTLTAIATSTAVFIGMAAANGIQSDETLQLVSVGGQSLPVVLEEEGECREELQAATLTLRTNGEWSLIATEREMCGTNEDIEEEHEDGTWEADGQMLRFFDEDGDTPSHDEDDELDVADLVTATRSSNGLVAQLADGETELTFRK